MFRLGVIAVCSGCHVVFPLTDAPFGQPERVALDWTWPDDADDPTFSGDRLEMYLNTGTAIARSTRATTRDPWPPPTFVVELGSGGATDTTPELVADGLVMYFASDRGTDPLIYDVFVASRGLRDQMWSVPDRVLPLTTLDADTSPSADQDNLSIVTTILVKADNHELHLSERSFTTDPWPAPVPIETVNSDANDQAGFLTADGLALYFMSTRDGSADLFVSRRASKLAVFETPEPLTALNSARDESDPWVSPDGREIYFISNRSSRVELWHATR